MEVVYYPNPVPTNRYTISVLGILFDRVLLPGLYLPDHQIDKKELQDEFQRIASIDANSGSTPESRIFLSCLKFLEHYQSIGDIFVGTGQSGHLGILEEETMDVAYKLEEAIYGPPPPNFRPMVSGGFNFGLSDDQVNGPSWISYPANAYVFAQKQSLPLFSDREDFPLPLVFNHNSDAKMLASYLAFSALTAEMPRIKPLNAEQILDVRVKMRDDIDDFHTTMLSLVERYRELVGNNPSISSLQKEAKYITETHILPKVKRIKDRIETPGEIIKSELLDFTIEVPEMLVELKMRPEIETLVSVLAGSLTSHAKNVTKRISQSKQQVEKSGYSLLLKLPKKYR